MTTSKSDVAETAAQNRALGEKDKASLQERKDLAQKAQADAAKLHQDAEEARVKAEEVKMTPEQKKAREAAQEADDARAKAAEATRQAEAHDADATLEDAGVLGYGKHPEFSAGHHLAQKFGNDPANPRPASGLPEVTDNGMVRLQRTTPDSVRPVFTSVHPEMVGDYLRAGWNRADSEPVAPRRDAAPLQTAPDGTTQVNPVTNEVDEDEEVEEEYDDETTGQKAKRKVKRKKAARRK